ncbi:hypothetical protein [Catenuloplanes japonicus]|uniref:hypothetical protein n=1 Tax=Catenuloplanes japonicus TaxID=33876 RepID=UPI0005244314|nr:hypothetical protein [Catenuloplanes japonicus]
METPSELLALCPRAGSPAQAAALVERLGGDPLLCRLAAGYLTRVGEGTFTGYRTELLMRAGPPLDAAAGIALDRLDDEGLGQACTLLRLLGVLPDAPVPYRLLLDPSLLAGSELFPRLTGPHLEALVDGLAALALITRTAPDVLSMDPQVRAFAESDGTGSGQRPAHIALLATLIIEVPRAEVADAAVHVFRLVADESGDLDQVDKLANACLHAGDGLAAAGRFAEARALGSVVVDGARRLLGPAHERTFLGTVFLAGWTGHSGDPAAAYALLRDLTAAPDPAAPDPAAPDPAAPDPEDTLVAFSNRAYWAAQAGDTVAARDAYAALVPLRTDEQDLLLDRTELARWTGAAGDFAGARDLLTELIPEWIRLAGPDDPDVLTQRAELARWTGLAGDAVAARDAFAELVSSGAGAELLYLRGELAHWTGTAGDPATAHAMFAGLLPDFESILGPDAEDTVALRAAITRWAA